MATVQIATRVEAEQARTFRELTELLGTTPADALRMFIAAFNRAKGFPYSVTLQATPTIEAFDNEAEATAFASALAISPSTSESTG